MISAISILSFFLVIIQMVLRSKIVPKDADKMSDTDGRKLYYGGGFILAAIVITTIFTLDLSDINNMKWLMLIVIIIGSGYNSFLYWKYIRESNEHIVSMVSLIVGVVYILIFVF